MFKVDGKTYNIPVEDLRRNFHKDYKYEINTVDGTKHTEVKAIYLDYTLKVDGFYESEYYRLWDDLINKKTSYTVELPYNNRTITLDCNIELTSDSLIFDDGTSRFWDGLTIKFLSNKPLEVV